MAPVKKDSDSTGGEAIRALCLMAMSSAEFNPDYNTLAPELGIAQAKNVARKLDTYIKPYGFQIKNKRVVKIDDDGTTPATPTTTTKAKIPATPATSDAEGDDEKSVVKAKSSPKKRAPAVKKEKSATKKAAAPKSTSKKRKVKEESDEEIGDNDEDDEATKMIKEKMGDGTDDGEV